MFSIIVLPNPTDKYLSDAPVNVKVTEDGKVLIEIANSNGGDEERTFVAERTVPAVSIQVKVNNRNQERLLLKWRPTNMAPSVNPRWLNGPGSLRYIICNRFWDTQDY